MEEISVGVMDTSDACVKEILSTVFGMRTHVPEEHAIDFKYVLYTYNGTLVVCTHDISLKYGDRDIIEGAIPSGTYRTLFDGTKVCVYQLEVE